MNDSLTKNLLIFLKIFIYSEEVHEDFTSNSIWALNQICDNKLQYRMKDNIVYLCKLLRLFKRYYILLLFMVFKSWRDKFYILSL